MIHKRQTLQVLGRRNKQQVLKEAIRSPASSTTSQSSISVGSGIPGGVGGCAGGTDSQPVTGGVGLAINRTCGSCPDPDDDSIGCYPNWSKLSSSGSNVSYTNTATPVDGQHTTEVIEFPPLVDIPANNQFGASHTARFGVFDGCGDMERRVSYLKLFFDGYVGSDPPVWSPVNQFGDPEETVYFDTPSAPSIEYYQDTFNIDNGSTFATTVNINSPMVFAPNVNPLGIPDPEWAINNDLIYYDSSKIYPSYNLPVGLPLDEWIFVWYLQDEFDFTRYFIRTGLTDPSMLPIMMTMQQANPLDITDGRYFLEVQIGNCILTSLPAGVTNQMGASDPFVSSIEIGVTRGASDPSHTGNNFYGDRPTGSYPGSLTVTAQLISQAGGRDFDTSFDTYTGDQDFSYKPGIAYHARLEGSQDGSIFYAPTTLSRYSAVYFDGLRVVEGTHYTVDDSKNIIPSTPLLEGAVVEATFVAA